MAWTLDDEEISLDDYGITYEGEPTDGDTITVEVTSLLSEDDTITVTVTQTFTLTTAGEFDVTTAAGKTYTISDTLKDIPNL